MITHLLCRFLGNSISGCTVTVNGATVDARGTLSFCARAPRPPVPAHSHQLRQHGEVHCIGQSSGERGIQFEQLAGERD